MRENKKAGPAGSAFLLAIYFWFQIHIRGTGIDLTQDLQVHLNVAGHKDRFVHIAAGEHRGGQVLDGEHRRGLVEITGQGAVVGHIADGQARQIAGDTQLGYLHDRQGRGCKCRWPAG